MAPSWTRRGTSSCPLPVTMYYSSPVICWEPPRAICGLLLRAAPIAQSPTPNSDMLSCLADVYAAVVLSVFLATITKLDKLITEPVAPACWVILLM